MKRFTINMLQKNWKCFQIRGRLNGSKQYWSRYSSKFWLPKAMKVKLYLILPPNVKSIRGIHWLRMCAVVGKAMSIDPGKAAVEPFYVLRTCIVVTCRSWQNIQYTYACLEHLNTCIFRKSILKAGAFHMYLQSAYRYVVIDSSTIDNS